MRTRKGYNDITPEIEELNKITSFKKASIKFWEIIGNKLNKVKDSQANRIWKSRMKSTTSGYTTAAEFQLKASHIMFQGSPDTKSFPRL